MRINKQLYETAELQLIFMDSRDVIATSGNELEGGPGIPSSGWV